MDAVLIAWFRQNGRDLPWRRTRDPYAILVSRGDAAADAGRARDPTLARLARALADAGRARRRLARRRDPGMAGARLQPARDQPAPGGAGRRGHRLAGRPDGAPGCRPVHGRRDPQPGVRRARPPDRHERRPDPGADGTRVRAGGAAGALRPRRDRLPGARAALRRLPAGGRAAPRAGAGTSRCGSSRASRGRSASGGPRSCGWSPPRRSRSRSSTAKRRLALATVSSSSSCVPAWRATGRDARSEARTRPMPSYRATDAIRRRR